MRCLCCNGLLKEHELLSRNRHTGEHEDHCRKCLNAAFDRGVGPVVAYIPVPLIDGLAHGPGQYDD